jgi:hypothetical protein
MLGFCSECRALDIPVAPDVAVGKRCASAADPMLVAEQIWLRGFAQRDVLKSHLHGCQQTQSRCPGFVHRDKRPQIYVAAVLLIARDSGATQVFDHMPHSS